MDEKEALACCQTAKPAVLSILPDYCDKYIPLLKKKRLFRNEKLKANRTSETEEQRKERLRIRREKDRARRRTKGKKRLPDTDDYEKQRLATLKRLKRGVKLT